MTSLRSVLPAGAETLPVRAGSYDAPQQSMQMLVTDLPMRVAANQQTLAQRYLLNASATRRPTAVTERANSVRGDPQERRLSPHSSASNTQHGEVSQMQS